MKIVNKLPILTAIEKIDENSILLKFREDNYIGSRKDVFVLKIVGKEISNKIELIREYHLNYFTAIEDEETELTFYSGNIYESPDWGDWTSAFSLPFEIYEEKFIDEQ